MVAVNYDWDELEDNIDEEYDDASNTIAEYTTEPALFGTVISQRRSSQSSFLHCDGLGSTLALTNAAGAVTDTNAYTAFGEVTEHSGSTANPFQYVGQKGYVRDAELGADNVRRRSYRAPIGRWLSSDPLGELPASYVYASNQPIVLIDPSGEAPEKQWKRRLADKPRPNPTMLRNRMPDYYIWIEHIVPENPTKRKQFWQTARCRIKTLDEDCHIEETVRFVVDIGDIGGREAIGDKLSFSSEKKYCLVNERCFFRTGFGKFTEDEEEGLECEEGFYSRIRKDIVDPMVDWSTEYWYHDPAICKRCCPAWIIPYLPGYFETLTVEGVGTWP